MSTETITVVIDENTRNLWEYQGGYSGYWGYDLIEEAVARVNRGSELLDNYEGPAWMDRINPQKLDMSSGQYCIIGQAYNGYDQGLKVPFGWEPAFEDFHPDTHNQEQNRLAIEYGFLSETQGDEMPWALLDCTWVYMLAVRSQQPDTRIKLELP